MEDNHPILTRQRTSSQKAADILASLVGSWFYISLLAIFLFLWMIANTSWILFGKSWDPFPFILLNLVLAAFAAVEVPIIMMSQNRQTQKDRISAEYDYAVNKKAEKEIREIRAQLNRIEKNLK
jgi:uncharacterized membrane protein